MRFALPHRRCSPTRQDRNQDPEDSLDKESVLESWRWRDGDPGAVTAKEIGAPEEVANRTICPVLRTMKGSEFLKRIRKLAKEKSVTCSWHPDMDKGSHGVLKYGGWLSTASGK